MKKITVLGAGAWGTTLGKMLASKGHSVMLWDKEPAVVASINHHRESLTLPGVPLPVSLEATVSPQEAVTGADTIVSAMIAGQVRYLLEEAAAVWPREAWIISCTKGLEPESHLRMSAIFAEVLALPVSQLAALSGPNHAPEIAQGALASAVVAAPRRQVAEYFQELFMTPYYRLYTSPDIIGVELGGALKNVIAIAAGICDGLALGDNTKAALVTRGLAEMVRLAVKLGGEAPTFYGLSGVGDLMVTCTSKMSRNRGCGEELGRGRSYADILANQKSVIEGARTAIAVQQLAAKLKVEMPICATVYDILYDNQRPQDAIARLMGRMAKPEDSEQAARLWSLY
ncbi:MAG: NAD(P)-dependent glycerol-3-phosphate dehydrogenase [Symbiobacteriaceae bacterium]|nr:NAD(P)-dependent glycerol-3-phosphate dehydrogenase [Symbiobacteriaceae bacterium]